MHFLPLLGFTINPQISDLMLENKTIVVNTINPHCYCETKNDPLYREALQQSDILIPDGIGIVWAAKFLAGKKIERIAGADLHRHLLSKVNKTGGKVFYLGSALSTLQKIEARVKAEYPLVKVAVYSPPYKPEFTEEENQAMVQAVNTFKPDVLFVGMTAPKQEKWSYKHKDLLNAKIIASVGAVFDFYAGTVKRPGKFWQKMGMEWFPRLLREPRRLWRRNFVSTPCFIWDVFKAKMGWLKLEK
jgi:N-acetylglucosaminyldiphosphoundecaprenol N-acetyl-beta-D-mannosaminyltransferase